MEVITFLTIVFAIYAFGASINKKGQQPSRKLYEPWKPTARPTLRDVFQEMSSMTGKRPISQGTRYDPYKYVELEAAKGQEGEWGDEGRPDEEEGAMGVEGMMGSEGTPGIEGTASSEGLSLERISMEQGAVFGINQPPVLNGKENPKVPIGNGNDGFPVTENVLMQGVIWAEILGKPRALRPYRGPRS